VKRAEGGATSGGKEKRTERFHRQGLNVAMTDLARGCRTVTDVMAELDSSQRWNVDSNLFVIGQGMLEQISSPYLTPWLPDPIGSIMDEVIPDFDRLNQHNDDAPDLYVAATNVNRTALRIFGPGEITSKALMGLHVLPDTFPGGRNRR
jgi:hypothetical protein